MADNAMGEELAFVASVLAEAERYALPPDEVEARLRRRALPGDTRVDLLWQREAATPRLRYDVLLRRRDETFSLGYAGPNQVPWPLLGAQRWRDQEFLRVDGEALDVSDVVAFLDFLWEKASLTRQLVDACLMRAEIKRLGLALDDAAIQRAVDRFRVSRGLDTEPATLAWLEERGLTHLGLEELASEEALVEALKLAVVGQDLPGDIDGETRQRLLDERFADWLAERRARATIHWNWGPALAGE